MQRWAEGFVSSLAGFTLQTLEADPSPIFAISERCELWYFNPAYQTFAEHNDEGAAVLARYPVGSNILEGIAGEARPRYQERFIEVMQGSSPWFHEYTCSSPERYREFRQGAYPLKNHNGLLLISSLTIERPLASARHPAEPMLEGRYVQPSGLITQCSNCRRTLRNDGSDVWDWVPEWVTVPPAHVSHTICCVCFEYHWRR
jgi:hypothetical protein